MFKSKKPSVIVEIPRLALEAIYDECDKFDVDETGGRIVGVYEKKGNAYHIKVQGVIGPGPNARRSSVTFFQDGDYQAEVFRKIEANIPDIEHLGNWHTHHVNGHPTLSSGDTATYQRIVNHQQHNTDFFYAILVVKKNHSGHSRYSVRHYFLRRDDKNIYELPEEAIKISDAPIVWPVLSDQEPQQSEPDREADSSILRSERVRDQEFFATFYPSMKPLFSKEMNALYWKGKVDLVDGSFVDFVAVETQDGNTSNYSASISGGAALKNPQNFKNQSFNSAREAVVGLTKELNRAIFLGARE